MKRTLTTLAGTLSLAAALTAGTAAAAPASAAVPQQAAQPAQAAPAAPAADPTIVDVTPANYAQVMEMSNTKPVVLDFTAEWCHWCQVQKPYLQQYHDQDGGSWIWARVDYDQNQSIVRQYRVNGIPALVSVRRGSEYGSRFVGFDPSSPQMLRYWLNNVIRRY
ncbi:thioredoxin family protein [Actinomadura geliboluensis]|uniref:Thioredoxin family protein n=1 Tax=Actinomadura geliboluensis TaxID=882440 RepID=A0A5S4GUM1_9ACTN|nr:thioredoxin family protein [Actinomadura geliboluensis]TMR36658.1 thioredoxin family protein [Actinomadura geliboluensis]